jgi:hypothetical protein
VGSGLAFLTNGERQNKAAGSKQQDMVCSPLGSIGFKLGLWLAKRAFAFYPSHQLQ